MKTGLILVKREENQESPSADGQICSSTRFVPVRGKKLADISRSGPLKVALLGRELRNGSREMTEERREGLDETAKQSGNGRKLTGFSGLEKSGNSDGVQKYLFFHI